MSAQPRPTLVADGLRTPECLRWHRGDLFFSDIFANWVGRLTADGRVHEVARFDDHTAGLGFLPDGSLLVALIKSRRIMQVDVDTGRSRTWLDLRSIPGVELNDMVVDDTGRVFLDNIVTPRESYVEGRPSGNGIVTVSPDREVELVVGDGVTRPNGLALSPDGVLYVAETPAHIVSAYTVGPKGGLSGRRVFADIAPGVPDGICLDVEGGMWIASPYTKEAVRVAADGAVTARYDFGRGWCTCVALGGPDRRTLYLTTWEMPPGEQTNVLDHHQCVGSIWAVSVDVAGAGWP